MIERKSVKMGIVFTTVLVASLAGVWFFLNPLGRFGHSCYAFTVYNAIPYPITDLQIRPDGTIRRISKTHDLDLDRLKWLLESKPDVLIVSLGWDGVVTPRKEVFALISQGVRCARNAEAIKLYNDLMKAGKRVAIHYHSTC